MKLISWNLNGLEDRNLDMRTEAAMFQILLGAPIEAALNEGFKANSPDIVVLQEVVERTYFAHLVPHFTAAGFTLYPPEPTMRSYFEVVAVRSKNFKADYTSFEYSDQGRGLTTLQLDDLTIMTAHLESMKPGKSMRIDQTKFILDEMTKHEHCIFAGDTNLRKDEWMSLDHGNIKDAWETSGSKIETRMTWIRDHYKSRYDRAWLHNLTLKNFETFGEEVIPSINTRSSDHLGLRVEFDL